MLKRGSIPAARTKTEKEERTERGPGNESETERPRKSRRESAIRRTLPRFRAAAGERGDGLVRVSDGAQREEPAVARA